MLGCFRELFSLGLPLFQKRELVRRDLPPAGRPALGHFPVPGQDERVARAAQGVSKRVRLQSGRVLKFRIVRNLTAKEVRKHEQNTRRCRLGKRGIARVTAKPRRSSSKNKGIGDRRSSMTPVARCERMTSAKTGTSGRRRQRGVRARPPERVGCRKHASHKDLSKVSPVGGRIMSGRKEHSSFCGAQMKLSSIPILCSSRGGVQLILHERQHPMPKSRHQRMRTNDDRGTRAPSVAPEQTPWREASSTY